uniref:HAT C-terminal dimerisation domain-containing protein n=1 Tax=Amphimedon queenslandica TaxID=400682 RepID=A0A1X7TRI8_AMPQE
MDKKATEKKEVAKRQPNLPELQLDSYIHTTARTRYDPDSDPILFWIQSKESYTFLAPFAIDILAAPSSSAPVERTFSTAGIATSGRRNRLAKDNLEKEVLLKKNEEYYMKIYSSDKTSV